MTMTFKEDLTTDLDVFFNNEEFAVDVLYKAATIQGIFDDEFVTSVAGEYGVESSVPQVLVKTSDVPTPIPDELMTINSVVYKILNGNPDGTGLTVILLTRN